MSTVNFTTTEKFRTKLAKLAADHNMEFTPGDVEVLTRRLSDAYNEIASIMIGRGLSVVQISTWARGEEYQLDIATFWYAKDSGWGGKDFEEKDWTTIFDRRKELKTVAVLDNSGSVLSPGSGTVAVGMDLLAKNAALGIYP